MANERIVRIKLDSNSARANAKATSRDIENIGRSADKSSDSMAQLSRVAAAVVTSLAINQIRQYADTWTNVNNRLRAATSTSQEFIAAQQGVLRIAQEAGVDLAGVADGYSRIAQNTSELGISQERLLEVTRRVTLAIKAGGATAQEASSVIVQLGQGLGAGALQGDELRSILEASIPITKALAKEFGVTTGELKQLGAEGQITADRVISAIENMDTASLEFTKDISSGFTEVNNALTVYVGKVDESFGVTEKITSGLSSLADNIDLVINVATALVALFGVRYVGALASATAAQLALSASSVRAAASMGALALSARALSASMALIGGPVGVAVIAAAALATFVINGTKAEQATDKLVQRTDQLTESLKNAAGAQKEFNEEQRKALIADIRADLLDLNEKYEQQLELAKDLSRGTRDIGSGFATANAKAKDYKDQIDRLKQALFELTSQTSKEDILAGVFPSTGGDSGAPSGGGGEPSGGGDAGGAAEDDRFKALKARLALETQAIQEEAEVRRAFALGQINQQQLDEELALQNIFYNYENRRMAIMENEQLTAEQKSTLLEELATQELAAEQAKQDALTTITKEGADDRTEIERLAQNARINSLQSGANSGLKLLAAFGDKSFKTQKKFAIAESIVSITAGIAKALNNPYPANLGFAAQVAAEGAVLISKLKSSNPSSGGVGATGVGGGVAATPSPAPVQQQSQQSQRRIIDIRGLGDGGSVALTKQELVALLENDEDVILASSNGQQQGSRVGLING